MIGLPDKIKFKITVLKSSRFNADFGKYSCLPALYANRLTQYRNCIARYSILPLFMFIGTWSHRNHASRHPSPDGISGLNVLRHNRACRDNAMVGDMYALENGHARPHPNIAPYSDIQVVFRKLIFVGQTHHRTVEDVNAMVASDDGQVGTAHDIVADADFSSGCEQCCSGPQVHVVAHVYISDSGNLAAAAKSHIHPARSKRSA